MSPNSTILSKAAKIQALISRGFIVLWATAIIWFYLGNLINFHQNRIWGKILIPACFTHSSVNNKDFGSLLSSDHDSFSSLLELDFDAIIDVQIASTSPEVSYLLLSDIPLNETPHQSAVIDDNRLRGPPLA